MSALALALPFVAALTAAAEPVGAPAAPPADVPAEATATTPAEAEPAPPPPPPEWERMIEPTLLDEILEGRRRPGFRPGLPEAVTQDNPGAVRALPPSAFPTDTLPILPSTSTKAPPAVRCMGVH